MGGAPCGRPLLFPHTHLLLYFRRGGGGVGVGWRRLRRPFLRFHEIPPPLRRGGGGVGVGWGRLRRPHPRRPHDRGIARTRAAQAPPPPDPTTPAPTELRRIR